MRRFTLAALAVVTLACSGGTINSESIGGRVMSGARRAVGAQSVAADRGVVLTSPAPAAAGSLEQQVEMWSELRNARTLVRFGAADARQVQDAIDFGTILTITSAAAIDGPGVFAQQWKANNEIPDPYLSLLYAAVRGTLVPVRVVERSAPPLEDAIILQTAEPIIEVRPDPAAEAAMRRALEELDEVVSEFEAAGMPVSMYDGAIRAQMALNNYLTRRSRP